MGRKRMADADHTGHRRRPHRDLRLELPLVVTIFVEGLIQSFTTIVTQIIRSKISFQTLDPHSPITVTAILR